MKTKSKGKSKPKTKAQTRTPSRRAGSIDHRREKEERITYLASFPQLNPNPIVEADLSGHIRYLNPAGERLFPDLHSAGAGHPWFRDFDSLVAMARNGRIPSHTREIQVGDAWYQQTIHYPPERDRIRIYGLDITERWQMKEALQRSEQMKRQRAVELETVLHAVPAAVWIAHDPDCHHITGNATADELLRLPTGGESSLTAPPDMRPTHFKVLKGGRDLPGDDLPVQQAARGTAVHDFEMSLAFSDGTVRHVLGNATPLLNELGQPRGSVAAFVDISDRKEAEKKLTESERKYRELYEGSRDGFAIVDMEGRVKEFNQAFVNMLGYSDEELLSLTNQDLTPPPWHAVEAQIVQKQVLPNGYSAVYEKEYRRKDGTIFPISLRTYLMRGAEGQPIGMWAFVRDITERTKLQESLRESERRERRRADELERRIQERTHDLQERVNELHCLYAVSDFLNKEEVSEEAEEHALQSILNLVPSGWQYPEITCARLHVRGKDFRTDNFRETAWKLSSPVLLDGKSAGILEAYYLEEKPSRDEGPFLHEEKMLLDSIARQVGEYLVKKEAQRHLIEQARVLETFSSATITPLAFLDRHFNFVRVNDAYAKACGRDISEFIGRNHFDLYPSGAKELFEEVVRTKDPFQVSARPFTFPDHPEWGVTYWDWTLTPVLDSQGEVGFLVFSLNDVTERTRAQKAVEAERQRFYDVLEKLPAYLILLKPDYHAAFANRFFRERFGDSHGRPCFDFLFGRSEPCENCETYTVLKTAAPHQWDWTGPDGRDYQVFDFPFTDTDGSPLILEMGIDISERKRAEEALRVSSLYTRGLIEASLDPLVTISLEGKITDVNRATEAVTGVAREHLIGSDFSDYFTEPDKAREGYQQVFARGSVIDYPLAIRHTTGKVTEVLYNATVYRNERGGVQGVFAAARDITERKRAEEALMETERQLRQIQKMEALGTLAGGIAHDFNNILMPIVINTELALLDTPEHSSLSNYLRLVQEGANRGRDLIKQIITFSRQKEQAKAPVEMGPIIKEALKFLRASIPRIIEIRGQIGPEPFLVFGDPTQIHQVLMNLCSNAAYAMREETGLLEVSLETVEVDPDLASRTVDLSPGPYVRLTVRDTGHGMDKDIVEKIFDPFFSTKKPGEGTGMGLAVVHGIVKNHGGAITVSSEVGKGSTFNIFLPRIQGDLKTESSPSKPIPTGKGRILLIDDEEIQIRSVKPMLERFGYRVTAKTDPREALEVFRAQPDAFDLVVTDQTMPHMTGQALAEELLRIRPEVSIILCTGFSEIIHAEEAKAMGIREFIMKPFSIREMAETVGKILGKSE